MLYCYSSNLALSPHLLRASVVDVIVLVALVLVEGIDCVTNLVAALLAVLVAIAFVVLMHLLFAAAAMVGTEQCLQ